MAEQTAEQKAKAAADKAAADKAAADKAAENLLPDFKKVEKFGILWLEKDQSKKDKYKNQKALDAAEKEVKEVKGLKAKNSQTLINKGVKITLVKGYPVSDYFSSLFSDKQKAYYFTK